MMPFRFRKTIGTVMISLVVGAFNSPERYHVAAVDDLFDMADIVFMIKVMDLLPRHASAISFTAKSPYRPSSSHFTPPGQD